MLRRGGERGWVSWNDRARENLFTKAKEREIER